MWFVHGYISACIFLVKTKIISEKGKILWGFIIASIALLIFPFSKEYIFVYTIIILFALGGAMIAPQLTAMVSLQDDNNIAKNLSYLTSINSVGLMLGPINWCLVYRDTCIRSFYTKRRIITNSCFGDYEK